MTAHEYIRFLKAAFADPEREQIARNELVQWGKARAMQINNPAYEAAYKELDEGEIRDPILHEVAKDFYGLDQGDAQTLYIHRYILEPIKPKLPIDLRIRLDSIPIAVLPTGCVNACAARAPNGDPLVLIDSGLLNMVDFFLETKPTLLELITSKGIETANEYCVEAYRFVLNHYARSGQVPYPRPDIHISAESRTLVLQQTMAIELFVLCHELGHIYAGHLARSNVKRLAVGIKENAADFYQLSWEQEFEADAWGWQWYQDCWTSVPLLNALPISLGMTSPLFLFDYMGLIETNLPEVKDKYSSHPPYSLRLKALLRRIADDGDPDVLEIAYAQAEIALNMPKFS